MVFDRSDSDYTFCGTAFALANRRIFITAAHVLENAKDIVLITPSSATIRPVQNCILHPTADLAIVRIEKNDKDTFQPFSDYGSSISVGDDFIAYGYPENSPFFSESTNTAKDARLFKGHAQRLIVDYKSEAYSGKFNYPGLELSIPCPIGLSGGPVFVPTNHGYKVVGLATENITAGTRISETEHTIENAEDGKSTTHYITQRMVEYGVALFLDQEICRWIYDTSALQLRK